MKRILTVIAQYAILSLLLMHAPLQTDAEPQATTALRVTLQPVKKIYRPGEKIRVSYSVKNVGPDPILIPLEIEPVRKSFESYAEFTIDGPKGMRLIMRSDALDPFKVDILKVLRDEWVRIPPQSFYGREAEVEFHGAPPGQYRISVTLHMYRFSKEDLEVAAVKGLHPAQGDFVSPRATFVIKE